MNLQVRSGLTYTQIVGAVHTLAAASGNWLDLDLSGEVAANARLAEIVMWPVGALNDYGVRKTGTGLSRLSAGWGPLSITVELTSGHCEAKEPPANSCSYQCLGYWS